MIVLKVATSCTVVSIDGPADEKRKEMKEKQHKDDAVGPVLKAKKSDLLPTKDVLKPFSVGTRHLF